MRRYNLSKIMSNAHYLHKRMFNATFGEALKESWKREKFIVETNERLEREAAERRAKTAARDYRNNRAFYGCRVGRDDWKRNYQNDAKVAVKRSIELSRIRANY